MSSCRTPDNASLNWDTDHSEFNGIMPSLMAPLGVDAFGIAGTAYDNHVGMDKILRR